MELVYLWVEEYKNIRNQGFNFSPRFECEFFTKYDKDGKLEDNCELKITPKDYVSIFPENINVTAIVGENGSGKSSVLEFIRFSLKKEPSMENYKSLIIFFDLNLKKITILNLLRKTIIINPKISYEEINFINIDSFNESLNSTIFPTFDYSLTYNLSDYIPKNNPNKIKRIFPLYPEKFPNLNLLREKRENIKRLLINYHTIKKDGNFGIFKTFFEPSQIAIFINFNKFLTDNLIEEKRLKAEELKENIKKDLEQNKRIAGFQKIQQLSKITSTTDNIKGFIVIPNSDEMINLEHTLINSLYDKNICKTYDKNMFDGELKTQSIFKWNIEELEKNEIESIIESCIEPYFLIEIFDKNNKRLNDLSFGEQQLLNILNSLYYFGSKEYTEDVIKIYKNVKDFDGNFHKEIEVDENISILIENFIILFDEIEIGLHPNWQSKNISYIFNFLKNIKNRKFHLIFATHSPFILSDIPKENVIFLEKYKKDEDRNQKEGNCKNATKNIELKTFGANIHTLLSNGFFMSDGLMGEFAKSKINKIKDFYEKVKKSKNPKKTYLKKYNDNKENFKNIQRIIGEPFLQTIIKNYLDELEEIFGNEAFKMKKKKEFLDQFPLKELQKYLDEKNAKA